MCIRDRYMGPEKSSQTNGTAMRSLIEPQKTDSMLIESEKATSSVREVPHQGLQDRLFPKTAKPSQPSKPFFAPRNGVSKLQSISLQVSASQPASSQPTPAPLADSQNKKPDRPAFIPGLFSSCASLTNAQALAKG
eukprot:TRINITY_DN6339_c0_g1_i5.p1 TRINITY_DN6339_c0_g1~~TRINITY_DN6339_c0_g1_i5.p1  ORF type:complete len:156 (+),score=37.83 TRINITY_DN6339_c0_g1_i5:62-469(+)